MQQVAQPWIILSLTHSPFWVGMDSFFMNAPSWIFTLWGGYLADRFNRKKIILICQGFQFFCVLLLWILIIIGHIKIWFILLSSFLIGMSDSLSMPAFQSIIPSIVEKTEIPKAVALNSIQFNLSRILGPVLAGIIITTYGTSICYGANIISFIPFFLSLYFIYPKKMPLTQKISTHSNVSNVIAHFKTLLKEPKYQLPLLTVLLSSLFCSPILTFCPVLVKEVFHGGAKMLGISMTAFGIGGVLAGLFATIFEKNISKYKFIANIAALLLGFVLMLVYVCPNLIFLNILFLLSGLLLTFTNIASNSMIQTSINENIRGSVVSLFQMALHSGISIGSLITGVLSSKISLNYLLLINGGVIIFLQFFIWKKYNSRN